MQNLLEIVDDMLVGAPESEATVPHPHERTVQIRLERRAGTVAARQMHCLVPARAPAHPVRAPTQPDRDRVH